MSALDPLPEARRQIGGQERRSPDLILAHVDPLVSAAASETTTAATEHDVPESQRFDTAGIRRSAPQEHGEESTLGLDDPVLETPPTAADTTDQADRQPEEGVG
jgi:hypothetical protein